MTLAKPVPFVISTPAILIGAAPTDLVGLDVRRDILNNLASSFSDDSYLPHPLLEKLVENGDLGIKTNKGIYIWNNGVKQDRNDL